MLFPEQDFLTFERYREPAGFQGLSDTLGYSVYAPEATARGDRLPNSADAWNKENRDPRNDNFGLAAYKNNDGDKVNYRYEFADGTVLFMTCKNFSMPNPGCVASTTWRGLLLQFDFRHRHLAEWQDIVKRIKLQLNSYVYQP